MGTMHVMPVMFGQYSSSSFTFDRDFNAFSFACKRKGKYLVVGAGLDTIPRMSA